MPLVGEPANNKPSHSSQSNRKRARTNPLAAARLQGKSASVVWHFKTGAGYQLFVEYYGNQVEGVVVADEDCEHRNILSKVEGKADGNKEKQKAASSNNNGKGGSRAAMRRKRKRGIVIEHSATVEREENKDTTMDTLMALTTTTTTTTTSVVNPRLQTALQESPSLASNPSFTAFIHTLQRPLPINYRVRTHLTKKEQQDIQQSIMKLIKESGEDDTGADSEEEEKQWKSNDQSHCSCAPVSIVSLSNGPSPSAPPTVCHNPACPAVTVLSFLHKTPVPSLSRLLHNYTLDGSLARQELASMIPVLALRHHYGTNTNNNKFRRLLDLCSAPGSKTLQLVEWMLETQPARSSNYNHKPVVIRANDVNAERLQALQEAIQRSGVVLTNSASNVKLKFTNQDASRYTDTSSTTNKLYDIILADVPCSGDGTVRKDARVLPYWTPQTSNALHCLQIRILTRALQLIQVKGIVVYSTCSLNPIENEAVVSAVLLSQKNDRRKFQVVPVCIPGLLCKQRKGVMHWKVADYKLTVNAKNNDGASATKKDTLATEHAEDTHDGSSEDEEDTERPQLTWYKTYEEAKAADMEHAVPTMWPRSPDDGYVKECLQHCLRLWPQDHDTGGFFVCMIQRIE